MANGITEVAELSATQVAELLLNLGLQSLYLKPKDWTLNNFLPNASVSKPTKMAGAGV